MKKTRVLSDQEMIDLFFNREKIESILYEETGKIVFCDVHADVEPDDCLHCRIEQLSGELYLERLRLVACSVAASQNREVHDATMGDIDSDFQSPALSDVITAVNREVALRQELDEVRDRIMRLSSMVDHRFSEEIYINGAGIRTLLSTEYFEQILDEDARMKEDEEFRDG